MYKSEKLHYSCAKCGQSHRERTPLDFASKGSKLWCRSCTEYLSMILLINLLQVQQRSLKEFSFQGSLPSPAAPLILYLPYCSSHASDRVYWQWPDSWEDSSTQNASSILDNSGRNWRQIARKRGGQISSVVKLKCLLKYQASLEQGERRIAAS